jgi:hypothetical protein
MSFRTLIIISRRLADATGDPLIKIATSKAPSATELEGRELSARRKAIDRALACLQVSSNLINREDLVWLVAHRFSHLICAELGLMLHIVIIFHDCADLSKHGIEKGV